MGGSSSHEYLCNIYCEITILIANLEIPPILLAGRAWQGIPTFLRSGPFTNIETTSYNMKTNRDSQSHQPQAATAPSNKKNTDIESEKHIETLNQALAVLMPLIEFHKAADELTMDDVRIYWDVRAIRGKDTAFAHLKGSSTLHNILAPNMLMNATERIQGEITDKIVMPMVAIFQRESNRMALEITAAEQNEDLATLT